MANVFHNLAGTFKSFFRIGAEGPSLRQGTVDPNIGAVGGIDGDIYIRHDVTEDFFQRRNGVWVNIGGEGFHRTSVTTSSYTIQPTDYYIGVNHAGPVDIFLPAGLANKTYVIKDESGLADQNTRPINIIPDGDETIDGQTEVIIRQGYVSLTLVFGTEWHMI